MTVVFICTAVLVVLAAHYEQPLLARVAFALAVMYCGMRILIYRWSATSLAICSAVMMMVFVVNFVVEAISQDKEFYSDASTGYQKGWSIICLVGASVCFWGELIGLGILAERAILAAIRGF